MKILICIPYTGYVAPQAAYSLIPMACHARYKGHSVDMLPIGLSLVYTAREEAVKAFLQVAGSAGLPLTTVDGVTVLTGRYPSRGDLERYAGVGAATDLPTLTVLGDDEGGACCGSGGCC